LDVRVALCIAAGIAYVPMLKKMRILKVAPQSGMRNDGIPHYTANMLPRSLDPAYLQFFEGLFQVPNSSYCSLQVAVKLTWPRLKLSFSC
jgi:hypothetical protein